MALDDGRHVAGEERGIAIRGAAKRKEQDILSCLSAQERKDFAAALGKIERHLGLVQASGARSEVAAY
jgi:hypothetical protein